MADERFDPQTFEFRRLLPWTILFRASNLAFNFGKILLGALGALALALGWFLIASAFHTTPIEPTRPSSDAPAEAVAKYTADKAAFDRERQEAVFIADIRKFPWEPSESITPKRSFQSIAQADQYEGDRQNFSRHFSAGAAVLEPVNRYMTPFQIIFNGRASTPLGLLLALWTLLIAALVAGPITRMSAVEVARDSSMGMVEAVRFSLTHFRGYILGPALPIVGAFLVLVFCVIGGLLTRVPGLDVAMGALWFLALFGGVIMALALLGLAVIWPLMYPAISTEATEGVDALTRAYSYLIGRPWNYLFYWAVALFNGAVAMIVATAIGYATLKLSQYAVAWGGGEAHLQALYSHVPEAGGWREALAGGATATGSTNVAALLIGFWSHLVFLVVLGYAYSYFWTASTIIYLLLRRDVDEIDMSEVDVGEEEDEPFPTLTGAPNANAAPPASQPGLQIIEAPGPLPTPPASPPAAPSFPAPVVPEKDSSAVNATGFQLKDESVAPPPSHEPPPPTTPEQSGLKP